MENEQPSAMQAGQCGQCGQCMKCMHRKRHWHHGKGGCMGGLWIAAWLFTIGFLKLSFWKGVLAVVIWAYYLGAYFAR